MRMIIPRLVGLVFSVLFVLAFLDAGIEAWAGTPMLEVVQRVVAGVIFGIPLMWLPPECWKYQDLFKPLSK